MSATTRRLDGRALGVLPAAAATLLAAPGVAGAHSLVRPAPGLISYLSRDATSLNTLTARLSGGRVVLRDATVDGGMDPGSCRPGEVSAAEGYVLEVSCPGAGVRRLRVELGEREDTARVAAAIAATLLGGAGADVLVGGPLGDQLAGDTGDDTLDGVGGDDVLDGGLGADELRAGAGDDGLRVRDGIADAVACGEGRDTVTADTLDVVAADCERVDRLAVAPPPGARELGADKVAPQVRAAAARTQRVSATMRTVRAVATASESGSVAMSGVLSIGGGRLLPVVGVRRTIAVGGAGADLRFVLTRREHDEVLASLRRRRRVRIALTVVATDRAGNSRAVKLPSIRLTG